MKNWRKWDWVYVIKSVLLVTVFIAAELYIVCRIVESL